MGQTRLVNQSRKGPFKQSTGRSRVLDRSAHVTYRRRGRALEITIRRGIGQYEMSTLIGKLNAHRIGTHGCIVFMIAGKRRKLGFLDRVDLEKLRNMIEEKLLKRQRSGSFCKTRRRPASCIAALPTTERQRKGTETC